VVSALGLAAVGEPADDLDLLARNRFAAGNAVAAVLAQLLDANPLKLPPSEQLTTVLGGALSTVIASIACSSANQPNAAEVLAALHEGVDRTWAAAMRTTAEGEA